MGWKSPWKTHHHLVGISLWFFPTTEESQILLSYLKMRFYERLILRRKMQPQMGKKEIRTHTLRWNHLGSQNGHTTPPKTNECPLKNRWQEYVFPIKIVPFRGTFVSFQACIVQTMHLNCGFFSTSCFFRSCQTWGVFFFEGFYP